MGLPTNTKLPRIKDPTIERWEEMLFIVDPKVQQELIERARAEARSNGLPDRGTDHQFYVLIKNVFIIIASECFIAILYSL